MFVLWLSSEGDGRVNGAAAASLDSMAAGPPAVSVWSEEEKPTGFLFTCTYLIP